jgi:hypothetical protein
LNQEDVGSTPAFSTKIKSSYVWLEKEYIKFRM